MIDVLLVDDHRLVRTGVRRILEAVPDIEVVGEAGSGEDALELTRSFRPDVVLMDLNMPGMGGLESTRRMLACVPDVKVVVLTMHESGPFPTRVLKVGARGFLNKDCSEQEILDAIRTVAAGRPYVCVAAAHALALNGTGSDDLFTHLTKREFQVLLMIAQGSTSREIAESLCVSGKTVSTFRHRLYEKLDANSDVELAHLAIRNGIVEGF